MAFIRAVAGFSFAVSSLGMCGAVLANGGGATGGYEAPSVSAPSYNATVEYQKAIAALKVNDYKTADVALRHALTVAPRDANVLFLYGFTLNGENDLKGARDAYAKAVKADAKHIPARREYVITLIKLGDRDTAKKEADGLRKDATACADSCAQAADYKAALAAVDAAMGTTSSIAPSGMPRMTAADGDRAYDKAVSLINAQRYEDALATLQTAETALGPHPDILTYIGFTYRKLGQYDRAESYYQQALAIAPDHRGAIEYYGELKVVRGDLAGAKRMLAQLDNLCSFGCSEAEDLRRWIEQGHG